MQPDFRKEAFSGVARCSMSSAQTSRPRVHRFWVIKGLAISQLFTSPGSLVSGASFPGHHTSEESQLCSFSQSQTGIMFHKQLNDDPLNSSVNTTPKWSGGREGLEVPKPPRTLANQLLQEHIWVRAYRLLDFGVLLGTGSTWQFSISAGMTLSCDH